SDARPRIVPPLVPIAGELGCVFCRPLLSSENKGQQRYSISWVDSCTLAERTRNTKVKSAASVTAAVQRNFGIRLWGTCVRRQAAKRDAARNSRGEISPFFLLRIAVLHKSPEDSHGSGSSEKFHTALPKGHGAFIPSFDPRPAPD